MIPKKHGRVSVKAVDGKDHSGYYYVENVWVTVTAQNRSRKCLLDSPDVDPEPIAENLLLKIVNDTLIK